MPSLHAQAAALRGSQLPAVLPPPELVQLPALSQELRVYGWRNPINDRDYDRDTWEVYYVTPEQSVTVVQVSRLSGDRFRLWGRGQSSRQGFDVDGVENAFAAALAMVSQADSARVD